MDQTIDGDDAKTHNLDQSDSKKKVDDVIDYSQLPITCRGPILHLEQKITESFLDSCQKALDEQSQNDDENGKRPIERTDHQGSTSQPNSAREKHKASSCPARRITIGTWEWSTRREGDFMAKVYYCKRKLVWEFMDGPLKRKMDIQWSDITAIRAKNGVGDEPDSLEIELIQPPVFSREINPQPRKHTNWQQSFDFTGDQASMFRRHLVILSPGAIVKFYKKLLQSDERLLNVSRQPFPEQAYPYFSQSEVGPSRIVSNANGFGSQYQNGAHHPFMSIRVPNPSGLANSSVTGTGLCTSNEEERNHQITNGNLIWNSNVAQSNVVHTWVPDYECGGVVVNGINNLPMDSQFMCCGESSLQPEIESVYSLTGQMVNQWTSNSSHVTGDYQSNGEVFNNLNNNMMVESQIGWSGDEVNHNGTNFTEMEYRFRNTNLAMQNAENMVSSSDLMNAEAMSWVAVAPPRAESDPTANRIQHLPLPSKPSNCGPVFPTLDH